jgi:hypothetical protein
MSVSLAGLSADSPLVRFLGWDGELQYPSDDGEPMSDDTLHDEWIRFVYDALREAFGVREYLVYDFTRKRLSAWTRPESEGSLCLVPPDGPWTSPLLGMTFWLEADGGSGIRLPDGCLARSREELCNGTGCGNGSGGNGSPRNCVRSGWIRTRRDRGGRGLWA